MRERTQQSALASASAVRRCCCFNVDRSVADRRFLIPRLGRFGKGTQKMRTCSLESKQVYLCLHTASSRYSLKCFIYISAVASIYFCVGPIVLPYRLLYCQAGPAPRIAWQPAFTDYGLLVSSAELQSHGLKVRTTQFILPRTTPPCPVRASSRDTGHKLRRRVHNLTLPSDVGSTAKQNFNPRMLFTDMY